MSSLISKRAFRFNSKELGLSTFQLDKFYNDLVEFLAEWHKKERDWKKIMSIQEDSLWPILKILGNPSHPIYGGVNEVILNSFINSITDENKIREQEKISGDARDYLKSLTEARIKFFEKILKVTQDDTKEFKSESSWVKWLLLGTGTIVAVGVVGKIFSKSSTKNNSGENKKT